MADPSKNNDDNWKKAVDMLTGYILPERSTLFDKLKGNEGIPLMHVRLDKVGQSRVVDGFTASGGWGRSNTDYVIPYYRRDNDGDGKVSEGNALSHYKAHITILGKNGDGPPSGNDVLAGTESKSKKLKTDGGWNKQGGALEWSSIPLAQYVHGSLLALQQLALYPHSTQGFENRGNKVADNAYVDLLSFTDAAKAFDRAVKFFENSAVTVKNWDSKDIGEGSTSWDGTGASLFKNLVHKLARNYEGYAEQISAGEGYVPVATLDGETVGSKPARAISEAQFIIQREAMNLYDAWQAWKSESSPQRWLYDLLLEAHLSLFDNQYDHVDFKSGSNTSAGVTVSAAAGFKNTVTIDGKDYGAPNEMSTWKAVGDEAVRRWNVSVQNWLDQAAADSIVSINEALRAAAKVFEGSLKETDSRSLEDIAAKEETKKEKQEAKKERENAKKDRDQAMAQNEKDRKEAKEQNAQDRADAEKDKAEARAQADKDRAEAKAQADQDRSAAEKDNEEAKSRAEQEKAEAKAQNEQDRAQADKDRAEARAQADQDRAEAEAENEEAKSRAEQEKAEAKAQNEQDRAEAEKERAKALAQNEQDRAEAKNEAAGASATAGRLAEQQRAEAKKERDEVKAQNERDRAAAEAENEEAKARAEQEKAEAKAQNEQDRAEAEKERAKALAQNEQDRAAAEKDNEEAKAEAEQEKAEALAQNEQDRAEARSGQEEARAQAESDREEARQQALQEKTQAKFDAEQAKNEAQADFEQEKAEARADRDAAEQEADRKETEAKKEYEREKAEAQEQREKAEQQAEKDRAEARGELDKQVAEDRLTQAEADQEFESRSQEIEDARRDAIADADMAEADAKREYEAQQSAAQEDREQARQDAEQARKDAQSEYNRRMADAQSDLDRASGGDKDISELIRQRVADLPQPPDLSSYAPAGYTPYASDFSDNLYNQDDLAWALGREGVGASGAADTPSGGSSGSSGPGMYPPPMRGGGGGGGEAQSGAGERTRNVLDSGISRPGRGMSSPQTVQDEEHRVTARPAQTSSTPPFMPPMGGGGGEGQQKTQSGDRERTNWLPEDGNVWGTDEGGAPQALGR